VVALTLQVQERDQRGQTLDQFKEREAQVAAPVGPGLGEAMPVSSRWISI
jgi:hypothetical protein